MLLVYSYPSIVSNGITYFTTIKWNPFLSGKLINVGGILRLQGSSYGVLTFVAGTLISSGIALLLGVPAGISIAIFLTQYAPKKVSIPISFLVELLAGIPSALFGLWGFLALGPLLLHTIEPAMAAFLGFIPGFGGPVYSSGLLAAGLILALMIVPIIATISRDAMNQTPNEIKEVGMSMGLTRWEVTSKIVIPYAKNGIFGSVTLGLGRALGETIAVAMVAGAALGTLPTSFYSAINTMAAFMATSLDAAFTDQSHMLEYALVEMALLLLLITTLVNIVGRVLIKRSTAHMEQY